MRLLIATQVLDSAHPNLGFFVRWIEEFARHCESVTVIASQVGRYQLPPNVRVHSLGKEIGLEHGARVARFPALAWSLGHEYDAVFVHMIPEFVIAGAVPWKVSGKEVGLWYVHGTVSWRLKLAAALVDHIFTTSPESCRIQSSKIHIMGHGIDTEFFSPDPSVARGNHALSVGRLMQSKHHDRAIQIALEAGEPLRIAGDGPEREMLEAYAHTHSVNVTFLGDLTQTELRDEYRKAKRLIHTSTTGSMDKVVLEALATDTPVTTTSEVYKGFPMGAGERATYIREHHSLTKLIPKILSYYG